MKLYHGTNGKWVNNIRRRGLEPRGLRATRNNWKHVPHQSNPKCVYLTNSYAPYFAFNAARGKDSLCAVIEVDTDRLNINDLYGDEDALEQISRGQDSVPGDMSQRTLHYRSKQFDIDSVTLKGGAIVSAWEFSLRALGTCAHQGVIPPSAITRIARWPHAANRWLMFVFDPTITVINQSVCGNRYKAWTAKLFGDEPDLSMFTNTYHDKEGNPVENPDIAMVNKFNVKEIKDLEIITV